MLGVQRQQSLRVLDRRPNDNITAVRAGNGTTDQDHLLRFANLENAQILHCHTFVAHVAHAAAAINAGMCEVALVLYGSTAASSATAIGTGMGGERRDASASVTSPGPPRHDHRW